MAVGRKSVTLPLGGVVHVTSSDSGKWLIVSWQRHVIMWIMGKS